MKTALLRIIVNLLDLAAGPYRTLTHRNAPPGFVAWLGILIGMPMSVVLVSPDSGDDRQEHFVVWVWFATLAIGLGQTVAAWRWRGAPRFWLGRAEEAFIFVLTVAAWHFGCFGLAASLLVGGVLNMLRSRLIELGFEPYNDAVTPSRLLGFPLRLFAGPYRALAYKPGAFGGKRVGTITWLGILLAYPIFYDVWEPDWKSYKTYEAYQAHARFGAYGGWITFGVAAYIQMMVTWCGARPQPDEGRSHCWVGSWEPFLAGGLAFGANTFICRGAAYFIGAGYFSSLSLIGLTRLQRRIDAWSEADAERVAAIVLAGKARTKAAASVLSGGLLGASAYIAGVAAHSLSVTWDFLKSLRRTPVEGQVAYKPPTFTSRVGSHIVAHFAISLILGTVGVGFLFKCFAIVLAVPLWLIGWKVEAPPDVQHESRGFFSRMVDGMKDKAHDARERAGEAWDEKREEISERVHDAREGLGRRYAEEKSDLATKAQGIATKAVTNGVRGAVWGN